MSRGIDMWPKKLAMPLGEFKCCVLGKGHPLYNSFHFFCMFEKFHEKCWGKKIVYIYPMM